jgi:DNA repair ATPase RecN
MDESRRLVVKFLEKEIKTYMALALFLSKRGIKEHVRVGAKKVVICPAFYKERMKEAKRLVYELRKPK